MSRKKNAPVVIVRKDKRLNKTGHLLAFALTGGTSAIYTATKAATNAGYNARTRELQAGSESAESSETEATPRRKGPVERQIEAERAVATYDPDAERQAHLDAIKTLSRQRRELPRPSAWTMNTELRAQTRALNAEIQDHYRALAALRQAERLGG